MRRIIAKIKGALAPPSPNKTTLKSNDLDQNKPSVEPIIEEPAVDKSIVDEPLVDKSVVEKPLVNKPIVDEPTQEFVVEIIESVEQADTPEKQWQFYEAWLSQHYDQGLKNLNPGVTEGHLIILEKTLNNELPKDYRNWLRIHNGQRADSAGLLHGHELLQVARLLEEWFAMKKLLIAAEFKLPGESHPPGSVKTDWWNLNWLPITADGHGNFACIDLSPQENGVLGQIIGFDHQTPQRRVLANSFKEFVADYLQEIDEQQYTYSKNKDALIPSKTKT